MKQVSLSKAAVAAAAFTCAALFSFGWSGQSGVSLSIDSVEARVGRPLTPVSVAGVSRRQARRATYGYGAGAVGTGVGVAAVGTAAAVGATQPWGWGTGPYAGTGYYGGGPARAAYYNSYGSYGGPSCTPGTLYSGPDGLVQMCK